MLVSLLIRAIAIATIAALAAWLSVAVMVTWGMDTELLPIMATSTLPLALLGSFAIGLPISLLVYFLAGKSLSGSPGIVFMIANLAGVMMTLAAFLLADERGALFLGIPSWLAANVFAGLGWLWILRPSQKLSNA